MTPPTPTQQPPAAPTPLTGLTFGIAAYIWWGICPIYFKLVAHIPPLEILAHRVVQTLILLSLFLLATKRLAQLRTTLQDRKTKLALTASSTLIAINWLTFIYAVSTDRIVEASLGYFINPLVSVILGMTVLGERPRPAQWLSLTIAAIGVAWLTYTNGSLPWISIVLAISFALYGLIRKQTKATSLIGLTIETAILAPIAIAFLILITTTNPTWLPKGAQTPLIDLSPTTNTLLIAAAGLVTMLPLLWFAKAAKALPLITLGLLQYLAPSLQFLMGVAVFSEPFTTTTAIGYATIWAAIALFATDAIARARRKQQKRPTLPPQTSHQTPPTQSTPNQTPNA